MGLSGANVTTPGRLAQLGERLPYKQEVGGSIPSPPTGSPLQTAGFRVFDLLRFTQHTQVRKDCGKARLPAHNRRLAETRQISTERV
jgi:hypothetical protein